MASIHKRGDKYLVRWRDPDGSERTRSCPSQSSAKELRRAVEEATALGRRWEPAAAVRIPLLTEIIDGWIRELIRLGRQPRTIRRAHDAALCYLASLPSNADVRELTRGSVAAFDLAEYRRGVSPATRRATMWAIKGAWQWGQTYPSALGIIAPVDMPAAPSLVQRLVVAPTWRQMDAVCEAARVNAEEYPSCEWVRRLAILLRGLGWRMSQLLALAWADVDLRLGMIVCRNGKSTQERAGREQPMAAWLVAEMSRWPDKRGAVLGSDKTPTAVPLVMRRLWAKTRAPEAVYRQRPDHAFRIGLISGLTALRAPPDAIEYYVGHALPSTRRAYLDPSTIGLGEVARLIPPIEWGVVQIPFSRSSRGTRVVRAPRM